LKCQHFIGRLLIVVCVCATFSIQSGVPASADPARMLASDAFSPLQTFYWSGPENIRPPSDGYSYINRCNQQVFTTPVGVDYLEFLAVGTPGSSTQNSSGGEGAFVDGMLHTRPGEKFYITVAHSTSYLTGAVFGGFPGGGYGNAPGGGATMISTEPQRLETEPERGDNDLIIEQTCLPPPASVVLAAAGGGGGFRGVGIQVWDGGNGGNAGLLDGFTGISLDAESGHGGQGDKSGEGGQGGTATRPGAAGSHPGCGSEYRNDGGYMLGGLSKGNSAGGGAGFNGGGAGGGGDCFLNTGNGGGGGGTSYFDPSRSIYVASRFTTDQERLAINRIESGSVQIFGASASVATISTNAQVALAPMTGWWACGAPEPPIGSKGNLRIFNSHAPGLNTSVNVVSYIEASGRSWQIAPDKDRAAFVLIGDNNQAISRPTLFTLSDSSRKIMALFLISDLRQYWYLRLTREITDKLQFAFPSAAGGSFDLSCTRSAPQ
jgi:hypothetical protein